MKNKILLIDDNVSTVMFLPDILETYGYSSVVVDSGYKAVELVKKSFYSVIMCDINMPGMDGLETLKQIKKISPLSVVIMMTAGAPEHTVRETIKEGAYDVINKPFDMDSLLKTIFKVINEPVVLVVESDISCRDTLKKKLLEQDYKVVEADNESDILELIESGRTDIAILDIDEIWQNDFKNLRNAVAAKPDMSLIFVTEKYNEEIARKEIELGSIHCISKPVQMDEVIKNIELARAKIKKENIRRVLVVEDDKSLNKTLTGILSKEGYDVDAAYTGKEALNKLNNNFYNTAIVDFKLPDINGIDIVKKIKKSSNINIIFLSGHATLDLAIEAIREEVTDFFTKPVDMEKLLAKLRKISGENL